MEFSLAGQNFPSWRINILRPSFRSPPCSWADLRGSTSSSLRPEIRSAFDAFIFISFAFLCFRLCKDMSVRGER